MLSGKSYIVSKGDFFGTDFFLVCTYDCPINLGKIVPTTVDVYGQFLPIVFGQSILEK